MDIDTIKILIVDDSAVYRNLLRGILSNRKKLEIVGTANNGVLALHQINQYKPDLVIMDMEMPVMNGSDAIKEIRKTNSDLKILVFSGLSRASIASSLSLLDSGVIDVMTKPEASQSDFVQTKKAITEALIPKIYNLFYLDVSTIDPEFKDPSSGLLKKVSAEPLKRIAAETGSQPSPDEKKLNQRPGTDVLHLNLRPHVIIIASSTGGPGALEAIFKDLGSPDCVPILIVQHMPVEFTKIFSERLNSICSFEVKEAVHGETIKNGTVYIAPGDYHMEVEYNDILKAGKIVLHQQEKKHFVRPAADYLFNSVARQYRQNCYGMVLTGMGNDGAIGATEVKRHGGHILIQSEESAVVWGMAGATYRADAWSQMGDLDFCREVLTSFIGNVS